MTAPVLLAGPTASGKSDAAEALAALVGGEIISVDSMQVYRGLDIGTAKPTPAERARTPHHLIDIADLSESFDAARFVAEATKAVGEIQGRGRIPILCGGSGLYFNAWLHGLGTSPAPDPALREAIESTPLPELLDELARRDPVAFDEIDLENRRRVVRAVEVIRLTGRPFSQQRARWPERGQALAGRSFGLLRDRDDLRRRIHRRVDAMFNAGLIDETKRLMGCGLEGNRTAMQAIGYRQVVEHLRGERSRLETIELVKQKTCQYAKRQMTWFRAQLDLEWIETNPESTPVEMATLMAGKIGHGSKN
jgi:tRNA dimethylallyltransferase